MRKLKSTFIFTINFILLFNLIFFYSNHTTSAYEQTNTKIIDDYKTAYYDYLSKCWKNELAKIEKCFDDLSENALYTDRLLIEKTSETDILELAKLLMDKEVIRYLNAKKMKPFKGLDDAVSYVKQSLKSNTIKFTVRKKNDSTVIGNIGFYVNPKEKQIYLGYYFGKEYQDKGYAFESVSALTKKIIDSIDSGCLTILYKTKNIPSEKLAKKVVNFLTVDTTKNSCKFKSSACEGTISKYTCRNNNNILAFSTETLYISSKIKCLEILKIQGGNK